MNNILSIRKTIFITLLLFIASCQNNGYKKFYTSFVKTEQLETMRNNPDFQFLKHEETPKVYKVHPSSLEVTVKKMQENHFLAIGRSSFNGATQSIENAVMHGENIGALIILISSPKYTNTISSVTSYDYQIFTSHTRRYDQGAIYYIKDNRISKLKFGVRTDKISRKERILAGSTGVKVITIFKNSPAYHSDLLLGDIIIKINEHKINNLDDFLIATKLENNPSIWVIIRKNKKKIISITHKQ